MALSSQVAHATTPPEGLRCGATAQPPPGTKPAADGKYDNTDSSGAHAKGRRRLLRPKRCKSICMTLGKRAYMYAERTHQVLQAANQAASTAANFRSWRGCGRGRNRAQTLGRSPGARSRAGRECPPVAPSRLRPGNAPPRCALRNDHISTEARHHVSTESHHHAGLLVCWW